MTDKQKIRAEIKRSMKACEEAFNICPSTAFGSRIDSYKALLSFIDSLPEETVSKDLEEELSRFLDEEEGIPKMCNTRECIACGVDIARHFAEWGRNHFEDKSEMVSEDLEEVADKYAENHGFRVPYDGSNKFYDDVDVKASKEGFIAGAEWQKQQMIKDVMETTIVNDWQYGKDQDHAIIPAIHQRIEGFNVGDKVKIIIIKEEGK